MNLLSRIAQVEPLIGNTPLYKLNSENSNLYAKLEYYQLSDSMKVRPAYYIISKAIQENLINEDTVIIESSSGNFGIALAGLCRLLGLKFIPVIDAATSPQKEKVLRLLSHKVIKITERDETGGYLLNRIKTVNEYLATHTNCYNPNQYENPNNYYSYYNGMALEVYDELPNLDYLFISVSSGGTVTGLSMRLKEKCKNLKVIAVDVEGSLIFRDKPQARNIGGMGSSKRSAIIENACIDDVIILSESEIIKGCKQLLDEQMIFGGASSGAAYAAAKKRLAQVGGRNLNSLFICPDSGTAYVDTVYDDVWTEKNIFKTKEIENLVEA